MHLEFVCQSDACCTLVQSTNQNAFTHEIKDRDWPEFLIRCPTMGRIQFKFNRVLAMYQRLGERLEELANEIADRKEVAAMAKKAEEDRMERRRLQQQQQQQQHQMVTSESWDDDDHPSFGLGPDSRKKRNPANYCPACRGRLQRRVWTLLPNGPFRGHPLTYERISFKIVTKTILVYWSLIIQLIHT